MRKFAMWLMLASVCSAQQINPNQIQPANVGGYVLTTVTANQPPSWQPSSGGGGGISPAAQYEIPTYTNPGTSNQIGGALNFQALPDTLTPAQKTTALAAFTYYAGDVIMATTGQPGPIYPYTHAPFTNNSAIAIIGDRLDI